MPRGVLPNGQESTGVQPSESSFATALERGAALVTADGKILALKSGLRRFDAQA